MFELTKEQESAVKSLERAFKKCDDANVYLHACYHNLIAYNGNTMWYVDDTPSEYSERDEGCDGRMIITDYDLVSWADDEHFIHVKGE